MLELLQMQHPNSEGLDGVPSSSPPDNLTAAPLLSTQYWDLLNISFIVRFLCKKKLNFTHLLGGLETNLSFGYIAFYKLITVSGQNLSPLRLLRAS